MLVTALQAYQSPAFDNPWSVVYIEVLNWILDLRKEIFSYITLNLLI